jgi:hypothetical protein
LGCVADSFNDTTILSDAVLLDCKSFDRSLANIEQNCCCCQCLTQKRADFKRGDSAEFQLCTIFVQCFHGEKTFEKFPAGTDGNGGPKFFATPENEF